MAEIKKLPREIADQISAGEVIERPASVVKELVENSIDAGSSRIIIEVENGGKDKIRVLDNGCGINKEELKLAFSRYATSKINNINDIYSLQTLGFRGEALASIASVSRVEIMSRKKDSNKGKKMIIKGGKIQNTGPCGCQKGTDITVTDLFYNTPARFKYLKTTSTEFSHISDIIYREALAHPCIKFLLSHNNRNLIITPGSGKLLDCIQAIYDRELTENLLPVVNFTDRFVTVKGYISRPDYNRSSRYYETFIVNNRPVHNTTLNYAVEEAYSGYLKGRKYPVVFLNIVLNPVLIDVNVHPTKRKIKFSRKNIIKDIIKKGLRKHIKNCNPAAKFIVKQSETGKQNIKQEKLITENQTDKTNKNSAKNLHQKEVENKMQIKDKFNNKQQIKDNFSNKMYRIDLNKKNNTFNTFSKNVKTVSEKESKYTEKPEIIRIMGQMHNSYIIVVAEDGFLIIDQHAAHERVLYEKIVEKYNSSNLTTQPLLIPINIELTVAEFTLVKENLKIIENLGFILEAFGSKSYVIREVPLYIKNRVNKEVIKEIIDKFIRESKSLKKTDLINQIILYMSCRGAIKAGDKLNEEEIVKLVEDLFQTSNPYNCPHGRPTLLHVTEKELEKGLGRT